MECPFCSIGPAKVCLTNDYAIAFRDGFPISPGHTLVVPKRHVQSSSELSEVEQQALWSLHDFAPPTSRVRSTA